MKITEAMSDRMKRKFEAALNKVAAKHDFRTLDTLEKMVSGALPINYALIDRILNEDIEIDEPAEIIDDEKITTEEDEVIEPEAEVEPESKYSTISEIVNELESKLVNATEEEKPSIELQLSVMKDKMDSLKTPENDIENATEEAPYQKTHFLDTDNITEGCMTKKFESMSNSDIAKYIFKHPHTKFGDKIKECDTKDLIKQIKNIKKVNEDGESATTTAAVAVPELPIKLKESK